MTIQTYFFSLLVKEKMNKILYIILSLLLFSLTIISCSKSSDDGSKGTDNTTTTDNTPTTDNTTNLTWTKQLGSSGHEFGLGVTTDSSDNIYVTGLTYEDVVCPILLLAGEECIYTNRDIILIKYNSSGTKKWSKHYCDDGKGVTTDSSGNIYVTGNTSGDLDGNTSSGHVDIFLVKYDSSGTNQ